MWFKQATILELSDGFLTDPEALDRRLAQMLFKPCMPSFPNSAGWVCPITQTADDEASLVYAANDYFLICLQMEDKVLPGAVIKQAVDEKVAEIKSTQDRKVGRKEKMDIKDEVTYTLLSKAFSRLSHLYGLVDLKNNKLIVNTNSASKLERFVSTLKKSFDDSIVRSVQTRRIPSILTQWLANNQYPSSFGIEESCLLFDPAKQNSTIRCAKQDLFSKGIQGLVKEQFEIKQLALNWLDRMGFVLHDNFSLSGIKFFDEVKDLARDADIESPEQQFSADFVIMTQTFSELLTELLEHFASDEKVSNETSETEAEPA